MQSLFLVLATWLTAPTAHPLALPAVQDPAPTTLRFSGIPDSDKDKLTRQYEVVTRYLSKELGVPVEYVHVPDYNGAVNSLAANKLDLVWLGGVTAVQAEERTKGKSVMVAARDTDLIFKSYLVANKAHVDKGLFKQAASLEPMTIEALKPLGPAMKDLSFTFGAKLSTSGHIMPRHFLTLAGLTPETSFKGKPGYQLQGGHSATLQAVASGAYDLGVLNYTNWEGADEATRKAAPVIYVTPHYVDYCMVAHERLGKDRIDALRKAFVKLDGKNEEHAPVLAAFSAKRFVAADPKQWDSMREVLRKAKEAGLLD